MHAKELSTWYMPSAFSGRSAPTPPKKLGSHSMLGSISRKNGEGCGKCRNGARAFMAGASRLTPPQ